MAFEGLGPQTQLNITAPVLNERGGVEAFTSEFGKGIVRGFLNVGSGVVGTTEFLIPGKQESLLQAKARIQDQATEFDPTADGWESWAGRVLGEALPYMGAALAAGYGGAAVAGGVATAGTAGLVGPAAAMGAGLGAKASGIGAIIGAASIGFSVEGQQAYDDAIAGGASENEANAERLIVGTINAAIEAAQITKLMKFHKTGGGTLKSFIRNVRNGAWDLVGGDAKKFTGDVLRNALEEGLEEAAQEGVSISIPGLLRNDIRRKPDGSLDWSHILNRVGGAFAGGAFAGGVLGGAGALVKAAPEIGRPSDLDIDNTIKKINDMTHIKQQEKDLWVAMLEEQRHELKRTQIEDIPENAVNVYRGVESNRIYPETPDGGETKTEYTKLPEDLKEGKLKSKNGYSYRAVDSANELIGKDVSVGRGTLDWYEGQAFLAEIKGEPGEPILHHQKTARGDITKSKIDRIYYLPEAYSEEYQQDFYNELNQLRQQFSDAEFIELEIYDGSKGIEYLPKEETRIVSTETGEELKLDKTLSKSAIETPALSIETPALSKDWDNQLINSVHDIDTSLREEHLEKIRIEKGKRTGLAEAVLTDETIPPKIRFGLSKQYLEGQLGLVFDPLKFDETQTSYYYQRILTSPLGYYEKLHAEEGLNRLFGTVQDKKGQGLLPQPHQIEALEKIWGPDLRKSLYKLRGDKKKLSKKVIDALNLPRALLASFDVSAGGRQGLLLFPIATKEWFKAVGRGYRAWTSPEYTKYIDMQIKTDPYYKKFRDSGGFLSVVGGLKSGEEVFISDFAHRIPGIRASERAYVTTLNSLRFYTFKKYAQEWVGTGKPAKDYKLLAKFINHATGRGDVKGLEDYIPALNATFFAPRLFMGRIQSVTDLFKGVREELKAGEISETRKIIAKDLVSFFAGGVGVLGLLSLIKGVDVEKDPRSSDFGKIRFGNTRIDFWGGYSQIARLVTQLIQAEAKGTDTGRIMKINRGDIVWRFIQSKLSPAAGISVDLIRGETFLGKQLESEMIPEQIFQRFTPLFIQDVIDAARYQGLTSAAIVAPLAAHGIGAMTYPQRPGAEAARVKDVESRKTFGKNWDDLSPIGQKYLMQSNPEIGLLERKARAERENFDLVARRLEEQRKVMNKIFKKMPTSVRTELDTLNVYIPGLSRYVSNGWYLNDKRYSQYQKEVQKNMSIYLTRLINLPIWNKLRPEMRASLVEELVKEIKQNVRNKMIQEVTIDDIRRVQ